MTPRKKKQPHSVRMMQLRAIRMMYDQLWPSCYIRILYISPKNTFQKRHFHKKTLGRMDIILNEHFPERTLARMYIWPNGHFPENLFFRLEVCQNVHMAEWTFFPKTYFPEWTFPRKPIFQNGCIPENLFSRMDTCQNVRLAEWTFPRKTYFLEWTLGRMDNSQKPIFQNKITLFWENLFWENRNVRVFIFNNQYWLLIIGRVDLSALL